MSLLPPQHMSGYGFALGLSVESLNAVLSLIRAIRLNNTERWAWRSNLFERGIGSHVDTAFVDDATVLDEDEDVYFIVVGDKLLIAKERSRAADGTITADLYKNIPDYLNDEVWEFDYQYTVGA